MKARPFVGSLVVLASIAALATGCASSAAADEDSQGGAAAVSTSAKKVTGDKAARLLAILGSDAFNASDNAMGGRSGSDVKTVVCTQTGNEMLDETDALYKVPVTTCSLTATGFTPAARKVADAPQKATVLYNAIADVSDALVESGMGKSNFVLTSLACHAGSCVITPDSGAAITVNGDKAARVLQGLALAEGVDSVSDLDATDLRCESSDRKLLDADAPEYGVTSSDCSIAITGHTPATLDVTDAEPSAADLYSAMVAAGLKEENSSGNKVSVIASHIVCDAQGTSTSCTLTP